MLGWDAWMGCLDGMLGWDAWMGCLDGMDSDISDLPYQEGK